MFDISFTELMLIAIVALVVIGPERLPRVARTAGLLFGRMQRYVNDVKADISREIQLGELKQLQADMQASARDFERSVTEGMQSVERSVQQMAAGETAAATDESHSPADEFAAVPDADGLPAMGAVATLADGPSTAALLAGSPAAELSEDAAGGATKEAAKP